MVLYLYNDYLAFMIQVMQAHWVTTMVIVFSLMVVPFYWFLVLSKEKAKKMAWITALFGAFMAIVNLYALPERLGPAGSAIIAIVWLIPALLVWVYREWFKGLDQRPLVGLQIFRLIGGLFLVEMLRGHIPSSFALPAGLGDVFVGLVALTFFLAYKTIPKKAVVFLLIIGVADFVSAFFFGFTSFEGPFQLFAFGFDNQTNLFPTGLIPFFLVPYAIVFHVLSFINLKKSSSN